MTTVHSMYTPPAVMSSGPECNKKYAKLQEGMESSISLDGKAKIARILCEIQHLSDVEKLLLYLKLPTGVPQDDQLRLTPPSCLHTANRKEQGEAFTWIRSHLEEHGDVCMPKAEVYDEYRQYCDHHELRPLCNADFGKMMKQVFPDINTRRLGQRGQSKYFYGGLRKKTDHAPPTLPELEIRTKTLEMDTSSLDNEVFKVSCLLICEWADKLLDNKFSGIQAIAEHLVTSLYVNTKSKEAFTLIAAMQESGNPSLKGSALFNTQPSTGGDRHKETNMLLQQKLQKNKLMQKQKEKLQAMKEEVELQQGGQTQTTQDRKTPGTPVRKSATPSRMSKTPKLPSPSPSPVSLQSPAKLQSKQCPASTAQQVLSKPATSQPTMHYAQTGSRKSQEIPRNPQSAPTVQTVSSSSERIAVKQEMKQSQNVSINREDYHSVFTFDERAINTFNEKGSAENTSEKEKADMDVEMRDGTSAGVEAQQVTSEAETPYSEMETSQGAGSHVRKINFDTMFEQSSVTVTGSDQGSATVVTNQDREFNRANQDSARGGELEKSESEKLSKSDGHISLKMLLERKDIDKSHLNKSLGIIEKSKNNLFVNQSNVSGRSAFVPFSQVQNRKESIGNQTGTTGVPLFIPTSSMNQSAGVAMIAVPSSTVSRSQDLNQSVPRVPDSIIKILPSTAAFQFKHGSMDSIPQNLVIQSQSSVPMATESNISESISCLTKDAQIFVSCSSVLSKSSSCDSISSLSPSIASSSSCVSKHARTRFTPIRPKASPNKAAPTSKEPNFSKGDNPAYDKRPVSEILKEKRAKEQAEVVARLQAGGISCRLPGLTFSSSLGQLSSISSTGSPKEVVIIVNSQTGGTNLQTVMAPSMFVAQSLVPADVQKQSIEGGKKMRKEGGQFVENVDKEQGISDMATEENVNDDNTTSAGTDNADPYDTMVVDRDLPGETADSGADGDKESEHLDKVDLLWTETPAKIAKLNITSPYRPDSACSLGRDTPVKIMKASDSCSSRPESACSLLGRETPSGARKRKSSDYNQRRDFKRLNSTGDEGEDILGMKLHTDALSPEQEARFNQNARRTRSCTYELDKDTRVHVPCSVLLTGGLQSPDISSLEREALLESGFPHSVLSGNLHKIHKQTSSVGVSAKSLRHSQQKLIRNKPDLDQRVRNFLQRDENICFPVQRAGNGNLKPERPSTSIDSLITKDSVSAFKNAGGGILRRSRFGAVNQKHEEPSGLPSDVADWINDTIEKRQYQNTSVMSEPDLSCLSQKGNLSADLNIADFKFEVGNPVSQSSETMSAPSPQGQASKRVEKSEDSTFMVPKAPALHVRGKDASARLGGGDFHGKSPRCQSLPSFSSPVQSPSPTVTSPVCRQGLFRATSMSPRTPQHDSLQGDANSVTSPVQRNDGRDTHPLALSVHAGSKFKEDVKKHTRHGSYEEGRSLSSQLGSYLASIQHTLQKPGELPVDQQCPKSRDPTPDSVTSPQSFCQAAVSKSPFAREPVLPVDRSLPQIQERYLSKTPFSDSGYHSNGPSPVQNATPVSGLMALDIGSQKYSGSQSSDSMEMTGVIPQQLVQTQNQYLGMTVSYSQALTSGNASEPLTTSANSAFVPIQGSSQDARYVTPIKPTVTLPNTGNQDSSSAYSSHLFVDPTELAEEAMIISPKSQDPPSYETAIQSLRKSNTESVVTKVSVGFENTKLGPTTSIVFQNTNLGHNTSSVFQNTNLVHITSSVFQDAKQRPITSSVFQNTNQAHMTSSVFQNAKLSPNASSVFQNLQLTPNTSSVFQNAQLSPNTSSLFQSNNLGHETISVFQSTNLGPTTSSVFQSTNLGPTTSSVFQSTNLGQGTSSVFQNPSLGPTAGKVLQNVSSDSTVEIAARDQGSSQGRVSLLANMGQAVENDGSQGSYGPFASKLVQLSRQTQQKPFKQQQQQHQQSVSTESSGIKSSALLMKQLSQSAVMSAGLGSNSLLKPSETPSSVDIPASLPYETNISVSVHSSGAAPLVYKSQNTSNLSNELVNHYPEGAISSSVEYKNVMDLDFISQSHFLPSSNEQLMKTCPSVTQADHSIQHISQQPQQGQQAFTHYTGAPQNDPGSGLENQAMLNFTTDTMDHPDLPDSHLDSFNIGDESIKNLAVPKDLCSSESELSDFNLILERLKDIDGQYQDGSNEIYDRDIQGVQQLDDFPMFED